MKYFVFKVRTNRPDIVPDYYIVNNMYVGYVGLDCSDKNTIRSILEHHAKVSIKQQYQLIASTYCSSETGDKNNTLHQLFCDGARFDEEVIDEIISKHGFTKLLTEDIWYEEYYPVRNCTFNLLKSTDNTRVLMDNGVIVSMEEFKKNRKLYIPHYLL